MHRRSKELHPIQIVSPSYGSESTTDMPLLSVTYTDDGCGVDEGTLLVLMNSVDITSRFQATAEQATAQVDIDWYLEEGINILVAAVSDGVGNRGTDTSIFNVNTPTAMLLADMENSDTRYRKRAAYKLLYRVDELTMSELYNCLNQLGHTPEPKAVDQLLDILQSEELDCFSRTLAIAAVGEAAGVDEAIGARIDVVDVLSHFLLMDESYFVKAAAAKSLGLTRNELALEALDEYILNGLSYPPAIPVGTIVTVDQGIVLNNAVTLEVTRAIIRIDGHNHQVGNPGDLASIRSSCIQALVEYFSQGSRTGGGP